MKRIFLTMSLMLLLTSLSIAQKVKVRTHSCSAQKCLLPDNKVATENRTYSLETTGIYSSQVDPEFGRIYGWERVESNPTVHGTISLYGFSYGKNNLKSAKKEKKDKEGNVTDRWTEYWYEVTSTGKATLYVYGPSNPFKYNLSERQLKRQKEAEEAKAKAEAEKKAKVDSNPFLKDVDVEPAGDDEEGSDEGSATTNLELLKTVNINQVKSFETKKHRSAKAALAELRDKITNQQFDFKEAYPMMAMKTGVRVLNDTYGFRPLKSNFSLNDLKSGDIRELSDWNNAIAASKTIMASLRYNTDLAQTQADMQPIIDFFTKVMSSYSMDDRKERKVAKAAFYNIITLQSYLDMHDANLAICNKYIEDKKLDKTCKRTIKKAERYKAHLAFLDMPFRHLPSGADTEDEDIEEENDVIADSEG